MSILPEKIYVNEIPKIFCKKCNNVYKTVCDFKCEYGIKMRLKTEEYFYWYKPKTTAIVQNSPRSKFIGGGRKNGASCAGEEK